MRLECLNDAAGIEPVRCGTDLDVIGGASQQFGKEANQLAVIVDDADAQLLGAVVLQCQTATLGKVDDFVPQKPTVPARGELGG